LPFSLSQSRLNPLSLATLLLALLASRNAAAATINPARPEIPEKTFIITAYGSVADGKADNTAAIQAALDAAKSAGGGTVTIPAGEYLSGPLHLSSNLN